jgi:germination protein YpeB
MSRRGFVRLISFLIAGVIAFAAMSGVYYGRTGAARQHMEYSYMRSLEHLSMNIDNIKTSLNKGIYSNSPQMLSELSGRLASEATSAKMSLAQLPITELNLENTNRFLSQVGNYSQSLAKRFANGDELTCDDRENLVKLLNHAENLSNELLGVGSMVSGGHLNFDKIIHNIGGDNNISTYPAHISDGFVNVEDMFEGYPELIYDGPFSDHLSTKTPLMLENAARVSVETSLEKAKEVSGASHLEFTEEQAGRMPAYTFRDKSGTTVTMTKDGGYFMYMLKYRRIDEKEISTDKAVSLAEEYLSKLGHDNMSKTYYECNGGVCTITFAGQENDITIYPDMVKIGVALDNGEIMSFDGRGFISAHHEREDLSKKPKLSQKKASDRLSSNLTIQNVKLAIIPSSGEHEVLCYEFLCLSDNGNQVLVYINADTGNEEQIKLLRISNNGTVVV